MRSLPRWAWFAILLGLLAVTAAILLAMGREPICKCGSIKLWHGEVISAENSQHITDWYTPSHVAHGLIFYAALHLVARRLGLLPRAVIATVVEAGWEILENTDAVIQRYREATIALDYFGDSVLNSTMDIVAMWLGFALAARLPVWASVALLLAMEVGVALVIRDNLTLNVLMLLWPLDAVKEWQAAR
ncbi:DUF2585 domain-containing protein [Roseomonas frigidaquae]|uniref:UPF0314 protein HB662_09960 n=1 Tax=Falsiroseomonas frigidaquae TaxID=487318 RepID=A0ABX1EYI6_9PROT|nr:DUF2585 domain-containing protein [Falsiroseomonas frigidaquae]NKE45104.1 DUF2585 domain-containing protein [Falsiroseomonas frigidaquae]